MIEIPLPRLLDNTGAEIRRITPLHASVTLDKTPLSTATLELPAGEKLNNRAWVEMYTINGSAGIYRVVSPQTGYGDQTGAVDLEHGAAEIGDSIVSTPTSGTYTAAQAFQTLFGFYKGSRWRLGTVEASGSITGDWDGENVLEAMIALLEQIPGHYLEFVQTTTPWTVNVRQNPSVVSAEGRLDRNVSNATVAEDGSNQVTRLYMEGLPNGYVEADNISQEGTIEKFLAGGGEDLTPESIVRLVADARRYINQHKNPMRSVQISGYDFYALTGESLDKLGLCKLYRLELPEDNTTISANISSLSFDDVYGSPYSVTITLDEQEYGITTALSHLERAAGGGSGAQRRLKEEEKKFKQFETFYTQTDEKFSWLATESEWDELAQEGRVTAYTELTRTARYVMDEARQELTYDDWKVKWIAAHPEDQSLPEAELQTKYDQWIAANPYAIFNQEYSDATRTERIISKTGINDLGENETLASRIAQEAGRIDLVVEGTGANAHIKPAAIVAAINNASSSVIISADHIELDGETVALSLSGQEIRCDSLTATAIGTDNLDVSTGVFTNLSAGGLSATTLTIDGEDASAAIKSIGPATASGGQITIPWTRLDGSAGTPINFNIADTQFYQDGVSAARAEGKANVSALIVNGNNDPVSGRRTLTPGSSMTVYPATYVDGIKTRNNDAALVIIAGTTTITVDGWGITAEAGGGTKVTVNVNGTTYSHVFNSYP